MKTTASREKKPVSWTQSITRRTTGIGSLPHHNVDTALAYSFKFGIPFLPQIPIRNPGESMIAQALEGLPGIVLQKEEAPYLDLEIWKAQAHLLDLKLKVAFDAAANPEAFHAFEPSTHAASCWKPFLWELEERKLPVAKIQIMGPLTAQWVLSLKDFSTQNSKQTENFPELETQIFRLVLARSLAMTRRLLRSGIQPLLYLDEPGFYLLNLKHPKHLLALQELKVVIQTLQREGALVGLHCCSNTVWEAVLGLGLDILSIDTALSLSAAFSSLQDQALATFIAQGGLMSFGIIPTDQPDILPTLDSLNLVEQTLGELLAHLDSTAVQALLQTSLFTPACGLALHSNLDAEIILQKLNEVYACFTP